MSETILITGASGFVASHIVQTFLEAGYKVRGTVRSDSTADKVKARYPKFADQLSFALVPDIAKAGAFDEAVKDVSGVIHTASPFNLHVQDNEKELLQPAIHGTLNVLKAVDEHNSNVQRVVVTSSFAAILDLDQGFRPGYRYTENDWNPCTYETAKETRSSSMAYCASKAFAERSIWEWMTDAKPKFSVATICPPWVFGPTIDGDNSRLSESDEVLWELINGSRKEVPDNDFAAFVNAKDVAQAHLKAYTLEEAANQRFIIAGGQFLYQEACDIIRKRFPQLEDKVPKGTPGARMETYIVDGSKAKKVLGIEYHDLEDTLVEVVEDLSKHL